MKNIRLIHSISFALLTILVFLSASIVLFSDIFKNTTSKYGIINFMTKYHIVIMLLTIIISIFYGFFWSLYLANQIQKKEEDSKKTFNIVLKFLSREEKLILKHLSEYGPTTTQAEISRISNMGRVKALRTVKKLMDKNIITVEAHGKQRIIRIQDNLKFLIRSESEAPK